MYYRRTVCIRKGNRYTLSNTGGDSRKRRPNLSGLKKRKILSGPSKLTTKESSIDVHFLTVFLLFFLYFHSQFGL